MAAIEPICCPLCDAPVPEAYDVAAELTAEIETLKDRIEDLEAQVDFFLSEPQDWVPETEEGPYVASTRRPIFHRPSCTWAAYIQSESRDFGSRREALEAGLKPCRTCRS